MVPKTPRFAGLDFDLEPMTLNDASSRYIGWLKDAETTRFLANPSVLRETTQEDLRDYVASRVENPSVWFWKIIVKETGDHVGNVKLEPIDFEKGYAIFGIMIGEKSARGKGLGTRVTSAVIQAAFAVPTIHTIYLGVEDKNVAAIKTYTKLGFHQIERIPYIDPPAPGALHMEIRKSKV